MGQTTKHFIINPEQEKLSKRDILKIEERKTKSAQSKWEKELESTSVDMSKLPVINHVHGKMVIAADKNSKATHNLGNGITIALEREFDNFNRRETQPVNAFVVSCGYLPFGTEVIVHHNAFHDSYKLFNVEGIGGVNMFSIDEAFAYLYRLPDTEEWLPCPGFAIGLRVFKPYLGTIEGIEPTKIDKKLYISSGEFKGKVCCVLHATDYEMIFQGRDGREQRVIRCRHFEGDILHEREEIIAIDHDATRKVEAGEYHVGLNKKDCKPLKIYQNGNQENLSEGNVQIEGHP